MTLNGANWFEDIHTHFKEQIQKSEVENIKFIVSIRSSNFLLKRLIIKNLS